MRRKVERNGKEEGSSRGEEKGTGRKKETERRRKGTMMHGTRSKESRETAGEEAEDEHN